MRVSSVILVATRQVGTVYRGAQRPWDLPGATQCPGPHSDGTGFEPRSSAGLLPGHNSGFGNSVEIKI